MGLYLPLTFLSFNEDVADEVVKRIRNLNFLSRKSRAKNKELGPSAFSVGSNKVKLVGFDASGQWLDAIDGVLEEFKGVYSKQ